ncbi:14295_t:CDS:2, partial [Funneliformis mosseae]
SVKPTSTIVQYITFPNSPYNFIKLEQEIIRLKVQELAPQRDKFSAKVEAYQTILMNNLAEGELQKLLNKQTEVLKLEEHIETNNIITESTKKRLRSELFEKKVLPPEHKFSSTHRE